MNLHAWAMLARRARLHTATQHQDATMGGTASNSAYTTSVPAPHLPLRGCTTAALQHTAHGQCAVATHVTQAPCKPLPQNKEWHALRPQTSLSSTQAYGPALRGHSAVHNHVVGPAAQQQTLQLYMYTGTPHATRWPRYQQNCWHPPPPVH